jgi:hypothetical protein
MPSEHRKPTWVCLEAMSLTCMHKVFLPVHKS